MAVNRTEWFENCFNLLRPSQVFNKASLIIKLSKNIYALPLMLAFLFVFPCIMNSSFAFLHASV